MKKDQYIARQTKWLKEKVIDRRQFVMGAIATGISIPMALGMADEAIAATPKKGGSFKMGLAHGSTTDNLDPATAENGFVSSLHFAYGNYLTEVDNTGKLVGELAESYEPSNSGKTWIFNLRKGVEFHNGKTLTADDVLASFQHHMGEDTKSAAKGLLTQVSNMSKDGDYRVIFELSNPNADFDFVVSDFHLVILPSTVGIAEINGVGTGGYILQDYQPGVRATFKRNNNYFKSNRAHFDTVEFVSIIDTAARQNAAMNGEVDSIDRVDPKIVKLLQRVPSLNILEVTGTTHYTMPMRLDVAPFDNYDLRMAMKFAVKRQELVDKILHGHGAMGNDLPLSPTTAFYNTDLPQREYDLDKAKFHYQKSGHSGAIPLSTSEAAFAGSNDAAQLIAASAAQAGINVDVVREPSDGYWSNVWNKKGWSTCYWEGRPTQDWMYSTAYTADTKWNDTAWRDTDAAKRFNELVVYARGETDQAKRKDAYFEAQALLHDDGGALIPMLANHIHATSKKIGHDKHIGANWANDGSRAAERWWRL